jgi:PAS domain S-box-containing protein
MVTMVGQAQRLFNTEYIIWEMQPRCEHRYARWPTRLENVEPAMNHLSIPADRVRHIEQDGLFGTWDWDFASGAVSWSDGSFRLLGFEPGSVTPSYARFLESMHPEDRFGYELSGYDAVLEGRTIESEFRIIRPDGAIRWVANKGEVFRTNQGQPYRAAGALVDITEQREAQLALQASEERYRALVKAMAVVEWRMPPDGSTSTATNWSALTGQPEEEIGSNGWMAMIHPDDLGQLRAERQTCIDAGQPYENCFRLRYADGSYRWMVARAVPLKTSDGSLREWVGMIMDVHAQKHAEEQLRISEERLRAALQAGRVIAWEYELGGEIVARSDNSVEIIGLGSTPIADFLAQVHPEDRSRVIAARHRAIAEGASYDVEFRFIRADGRMMWLAVKGAVLRNLSTMPDRLTGILFDITAQKEAEERGGADERALRSEGRTRTRADAASPAVVSWRSAVTFQPDRLATKDGSEEACLIRVDDALAAVLVRLEETKDEPLEGSWYLETGFGPWNREALSFSTLDEAEQWIRTKLVIGQ